MLKNKFKHSVWFLGKDMTVKEFLDYVLDRNGDFYIKIKTKVDANNLLSEPTVCGYYLVQERRQYKLGYQERNYLSEHNEYFKSKLPLFNPGYMNAIISADNEPIPSDGHDVLYFSK